MLIYSRSWEDFGIYTADLCVYIVTQRIWINATYALKDVYLCVRTSSQRTGVRVSYTIDNVVQRVRTCMSMRCYNHVFVYFTVWPTVWVGECLDKDEEDCLDNWQPDK